MISYVHSTGYSEVYTMFRRKMAKISEKYGDVRARYCSMYFMCLLNGLDILLDKQKARSESVTKSVPFSQEVGAGP